MTILFKEVCNIFNKIENTSKRLEKLDYFIELIKLVEEKGEPEDLKKICQITIGRVFAEHENKELGIGPNILIESLVIAGIDKKELTKKINETGDIGNAIEQLSKNISQKTLFYSPPTLNEVYNTLIKLSKVEGANSQKKKIRYISNIFINSSPIEQRYLARLILEDMRIGLNIPTILGAFAKYFNYPKEDLEKIYSVVNDIGLLGEKLINKVNIYNDEDLKLKIFRPIKPMLAQLISSIKEAINEMETPQFETKYDGARVQIHKNENENNENNIKIYSRKLEDITNSLPEIVNEFKNIKGSFIIEGECVAISKENNKPLPFQYILRRFRRKYNIGNMVEEINLKVYLFDILYYNNKILIDLPLKERRNYLENLVNVDNINNNNINNKIELSNKLITNNEEEAIKFYKYSLEIGHEGVMIKNINAPYTPGSRVKTMYKFKPTLEQLDVVVIGAKLGMGKRKEWYGSFEIAIWDENKENLLPIGHVGSGLTEEELEELTNEIKNIIINKKDDEVILEPKIVLEVSYEEIQKSDKYSCGYALRFPRVMSIRLDKSIDEINTIYDVERIFNIQKGKNNN